MLMLFPANEVVQTLLGNIKYYNEQFNNPLVSRELTQKEGFELVFSIMNDSLNERLIWAPSSNQLEENLVKLYGQWDHNLIEKASAHFYDSVIDVTVRQIDNWINSVVPMNDWNIWYLKSLSKTKRKSSKEETLDLAIEHLQVTLAKKTLSGDNSFCSTVDKILKIIIDSLSKLNKAQEDYIKFLKEIQRSRSLGDLYNSLNKLPMDEYVLSDIILEQGSDFRIVDWTRRMESKEWELEDSVEIQPELVEINKWKKVSKNGD